jgi:hypothetical protein
MNNMPVIFENLIIKNNAQKIVKYINDHKQDFGELGDYWQGRQIYMNKIKDSEIFNIIKAGKDYMISEFIKQASIRKPLYIDSLHIVRWTEGYELYPHADAEEPSGNPHPFPWRDFGTVTFLNEDFEGGVLYYPNKKGLQVPAKIGYSAVHTGGIDCLHGVTKITKGVRYTIASFLTYNADHSYKI